MLFSWSMLLKEVAGNDNGVVSFPTKLRSGHMISLLLFCEMHMHCQCMDIFAVCKLRHSYSNIKNEYYHKFTLPSHWFLNYIYKPLQVFLTAYDLAASPAYNTISYRDHYLSIRKSLQPDHHYLALLIVSNPGWQKLYEWPSAIVPGKIFSKPRLARQMMIKWTKLQPLTF